MQVDRDNIAVGIARQGQPLPSRRQSIPNMASNAERAEEKRPSALFQKLLQALLRYREIDALVARMLRAMAIAGVDDINRQRGSKVRANALGGAEALSSAVHYDNRSAYCLRQHRSEARVAEYHTCFGKQRRHLLERQLPLMQFDVYVLPWPVDPFPPRLQVRDAHH